MKVRKVTNPATPRVRESDVPDMVTRLLALYAVATPGQKAEGREWYRVARDLAEIIGDGDVRLGAGLIAAFSPATGWKITVRNAQDMAAGKVPGTLGCNVRNAARMLAGEDFEQVLTGPKTLAFARAIAGDTDSIVIDRWAIRAALGGTWERVTNRQYKIIAEAYREAARITGERPAHFQAITWLVERGASGWDMAA